MVWSCKMGTRSTVQTSGVGHATGRGIDDSVRRGIAGGSLNQLGEKLKTVEREISEERGKFELFGLFLREDAPDRWDLVLAAKWLANGIEFLNYLSEKLSRVLRTDQLVLISRIIPMAGDDRFVKQVVSTVKVEHGLNELVNTEFAGVQIAHAYVVTSAGPKGRLR